MRILVDTNVLLRAQEPGHTHHVAAVEALARLAGAGHELAIAAQNLVEFWVVATRPVAVNGLGWTPEQASVVVSSTMSNFLVLADPASLAQTWLQLVRDYSISGVRAHDARLIGWMLGNGIQSVLSFNGSDFDWHPDVTCMDPNVEATR